MIRLPALTTTAVAAFSISLVLASGCQAPVYRVQRAALVPHQTPLGGDGQPLESGGQLELGAMTLAEAGNPSDGRTGASIQVPGLEANAGVRAKISDNFDIGFRYDRGFVQGSHSVNDTQPVIEDRDVHSYTLALRFFVPTKTEGFQVGIGVDLQNHSIPWIEYRSCVDNCAGLPPLAIEKGRENVAGIGVGITPSYRVGQWTWFLGGTIRSHPTIERKGTETGYWNDPDVENGPTQFVGSAGATFALAPSAKVTAVVYLPLGAEPVRYRPAFGTYVAVPF